MKITLRVVHDAAERLAGERRRDTRGSMMPSSNYMTRWHDYALRHAAPTSAGDMYATLLKLIAAGCCS